MTLYSQYSNNELFNLLREDDRSAFEEFYNRFVTPLYLQAYHVTKDEEVSKDLVQELFIKFWERKTALSLDINIEAYLYVANRNNILQHLRNQKNITLQTIKKEVSSIKTDQNLNLKELQSIIEEEIDKLPPKMREIFRYSRFENQSYKDIAHLLNISENTVRKQISNALKILRVNLGKREINLLVIQILLYKN